MSKQNIILNYYREGKSQRAISRELGLDRKTVRKYIKQYEERQTNLLLSSTKEDLGLITESIVEVPKYVVGHRPKRKLTPAMEQIILNQLEENKEKQRKGQHKQIKKAVDIYDYLITEHNADISYSTVVTAVRRLAQKTKEAYIKMDYLPGDICEFDWGEAKLTIAGKLQVVQMAVFTSANENYRMAYLFTKQNTECFQEAHARFFDHVGGVFQTLVYDNMKVAVKKLTGCEKEPTEGLLKLSLYYGFKFRFCNVRRGNEKGHVEKSVEVTRRKAFAFKDNFSNLDEANCYLSSVCKRLNSKPQAAKHGITAEAQLKESKQELITLKPMFDAAKTLYARVNKYSVIVIDKNYYSVPDSLVQKMVFVKIYSNKILCFDQENKVAEHIRKLGSHEWSLQIEHYLDTFLRKPGALTSSKVIKQTKWKKVYDKYYTNKSKEFIELLHYIRDKDNETQVIAALKKLDKMHPDHVTTAKIKLLCTKQQEEITTLKLKSQESTNIIKESQKQLQQYDELFNTSSNNMEVISL